MTASKKLIFPVAAAIVVVGAGGWYALGLAGRGDDSLRVSGNIEAVEVAISFKIPGRVEKRYVDEGDAVTKGMPLAAIGNGRSAGRPGPAPRRTARRRGRFGRIAGRLPARRNCRRLGRHAEGRGQLCRVEERQPSRGDRRRRGRTPCRRSRSRSPQTRPRSGRATPPHRLRHHRARTSRSGLCRLSDGRTSAISRR